ncbi:tail fiber domain-containing protein [Pedobacter polaris]|uniref:Tail fiber domain-containing protein n=1 Tax=Pedobacter polaris TaxID=2571273 RepID=A0A4U1CIR5_9SPHI|nr:tail fiber domain-containing protein [Pedobacter polaris]TKC06798.1 tail fiber domain-containing protein [Pedobacter polaris]
MKTFSKTQDILLKNLLFKLTVLILLLGNGIVKAQSAADSSLYIDKSGNTWLKGRFNLMATPRTKVHPTSPFAMYVTGDITARDKSIQFRESSGDQGIGFTMNAIYTAGSSTSQDLNLEVTGEGSLIFKTMDKPQMILDKNGKLNISNDLYIEKVLTANGDTKVNGELQIYKSLKLAGKVHWDDYRSINIINQPNGSYMEFKNTMTSGTGNANGGFRFTDFSGTDPTLRIRNNFVGIGTDDPQFPLHVGKSQNRDADRYTKNDQSNSISLGYGPAIIRSPDDFGRLFSSCSIFSSGDIVTKNAFISTSSSLYSDVRLKKNLKLSSSVQDLEKLKQIEIVNYKMIDTIADDKAYKKVIAQQVQKVYPIATNVSFGTLPNVFETASAITAQKDSLYTITITKTQNLKVGDQVELKCNPAKDVNVEVVVVNKNSITVKSAIPLNKQQVVFVYGTVAKDVLTVDYDAIAMLNVSATQELARIIEQQQKMILQLNKQNAEMKNENTKLRDEQAATKVTLDQILARLTPLEESKAKTTLTIANTAQK